MNTDHVHDASTTTTQHIHVHETTPMDHSGHGLDNSTMVHDMMTMYFHTGFKELILFDFWRTTSVSYFVLSCFILFAISFFYEGLKLLRQRLFLRECTRNRSFSIPSRTSVFENVTNSSQFQLKQVSTTNNRYLAMYRFLQVLLHMLQTTVSYGLMLVFMTFNVWLCLSIIVGAGVGFFAFGNSRMKMTEQTEHCN